MLLADRKVDAKPVPRMSMMVFKMLVQSPPQVTGKPDIIKLVAPVKCVHALPMPYICFEKRLILLNCLAADSFNILTDKRRFFAHFLPHDSDSTNILFIRDLSYYSECSGQFLNPYTRVISGGHTEM